jgi:hypothetical protein
MVLPILEYKVQKTPYTDKLENNYPGQRLKGTVVANSISHCQVVSYAFLKSKEDYKKSVGT